MGVPGQKGAKSFKGAGCVSKGTSSPYSGKASSPISTGKASFGNPCGSKGVASVWNGGKMGGGFGKSGFNPMGMMYGWGGCGMGAQCFNGFGKGKGKKGKGKGKGKRGPSGPHLARERITQEPVTGEVSEWKGKYGWINPTVPVEHEKAARHKGQVFVSMTDLVGGAQELTPGSLCQFHVFIDDNGIGAEECIGS
eukprot:TRINITY_DN2194_c0_g1_i1.p1 TRINITY_DN2194_c0_g1~~TRINITY_DN2194_c0_g1_i1.p1  ORF type:complete len:195 (-),score=32.51 TRINITY_DN2194_c0_g1_i1:56-640(-)